MAGNIKLTPDQLNTQAAQMSSLASQYDILFKSVNSTMKSVNGNWSTNLAHNFSGKINSAQRSFSNVVSLLNHGAAAAGSSAKTMESLDKSLSKAMSGQSSGEKRSSSGGGKGAFGAAGKGTGGTRKKSPKSSKSSDTIKVTGDTKKDIKHEAKKQYDAYIDAHRDSKEAGQKADTYSDKKSYRWADYDATVKTNAQTTYWSTSEGKYHAIGKVGHTTTAKDIYISEGCSRDEGLNIRMNSLDMHAAEHFDPAKGNAYVSGGVGWDAIAVGFYAGDSERGAGTMAAHVKAGVGVSGSLGISDGKIRAQGSSALGLGLDFDVNINYKNLWDGLKGGIRYGIDNFFW